MVRIKTPESILDGVSVIICTYNGSVRIEPVLRALAASRVNFPAEILVVDNNSTDGTAAVAEAAWIQVRNPNFAFKLVSESQPGQAYARRAGVKAAMHELLVFCDDDNFLAPDYLELAMEIMQNPRIGAAGGQCEAVIDSAIPTFLYSHGGYYGLGIQATQSGDVTHSRGHLWGAGLTVRRSAMRRLYACPQFPILRGRAGNALSAGDDSEICAGLVLMGYELFYDDRLRLKHFMMPHRLTLDYLHKLTATNTEDWKTLEYYKGLIELSRMTKVGAFLLSAWRWWRTLGNKQATVINRFKILTLFHLPSRMEPTARNVYAIYWHLTAHRHQL